MTLNEHIGDEWSQGNGCFHREEYIIYYITWWWVLKPGEYRQKIIEQRENDYEEITTCAGENMKRFVFPDIKAKKYVKTKSGWLTVKSKKNQEK